MVADSRKSSEQSSVPAWGRGSFPLPLPSTPPLARPPAPAANELAGCDIHRQPAHLGLGALLKQEVATLHARQYRSEHKGQRRRRGTFG